MNKYLNLHFHSIYSGGCLTPTELVKRAKNNNYQILSLTDHNTIAGTGEFLEACKKFKIIGLAGVEIYTTYKKNLLHLLIYNYNQHDKEFNDVLKRLCQKRIKLINLAIEKLCIFGFQLKPVHYTDQYYPDVTVITDQLINNKYNLKKIRQITKQKSPDLFTLINTFLANKKYFQLPETSMPFISLIKLIKKAKGLPILAHPGQQLRWSEDNLILELKKLGLGGIEVFSPYHNWHQIEHYQVLAKNNKLLITGGSDYHCDLPQKNFLITQATDYFRVPFALFNKLKPYLRG